MSIIILLSDCNVNAREQLAIPIYFKIIALFVCFGIISLSFLAMYVNWTSILDGYGVGASSISGVQGRYFIPLLIPLALLLFPKKVRYKLNTNNIYYFVNIILSHYLLFALLSFAALSFVVAFSVGLLLFPVLFPHAQHAAIAVTNNPVAIKF